jgi:hypothetical protein
MNWSFENGILVLENGFSIGPDGTLFLTEAWFDEDGGPLDDGFSGEFMTSVSTNTSNCIPVLLWIFQNGKYTNGSWTADSTISDAVDGELHRVDRLTIDDTFAQSAQQTAILFPAKLNKNINRLLSNQTMHDTLMEIDVISKQSGTYCEYVGDLIEAVLLTIKDTSFGGDLYNLMCFDISRKSFADENAMFWREQILFRVQGSYTTSTTRQ